MCGRLSVGKGVSVLRWLVGSVTMAELASKLDRLRTTNDYPVLEGYSGRDYLKDRAMQHAQKEWGRLKELIRSGQHLPSLKKAS